MASKGMKNSPNTELIKSLSFSKTDMAIPEEIGC